MRDLSPDDAHGSRLARMRVAIQLVLAAVLIDACLYACAALAVLGVVPRWTWMVDALSALRILSAGIALVGWWIASSPDRSGGGLAIDPWIRWLVRLAVAISLVSILLIWIGPKVVPFSATAFRVTFILMIVEAGISAIRYLWEMLATRQLADVADAERAFERASTLTWLGPALYTTKFVVVVGPLIALVLYASVLVMIIGAIRDRERAELGL